MLVRWLPFVVLCCVAAGAQQWPDPSPTTTSATVTAVTQMPLDAKSCVKEKEFRSSITAPFLFNGQRIDHGAELVGHIQACNLDLSEKQLETAAVVIDAVALPNKKTVPVVALLQALGPPLPPTRVGTTTSDLGSMQFRPGTRAYPTNLAALDRISSGVVGLKNVDFENTEAQDSLLWVFVSDGDSLDIKRESQIVVRFIIAPTAEKQP